MLWLYRLLFLPALVLSAPYYLFRMRKRGGYGEGFGHRFGAVPALPAKTPDVLRIWLQAVSVGEMLAIGPLLEGLYKEGNVEIYLTTTTSTGYRIAKEKYAKYTMAIGYFPIDFWAFSRRAWRQVQPDLALLTEGERWPEHLHQAVARGVPIVAVNARLSDRSFRRMRNFRFITRPLIAGMTRILAAAKEDASRFEELGLPRERLEVTGNIKLDLRLPKLEGARAASLREELGLGNAPVLLGSSTWPGEEARLLEAFGKLRLKDPGARLLLVPRHAERRQELDTLLVSSGYRVHFRSRGKATEEVDIAVGDTTGELRFFTQLARVAVVGKSFPPHTEGQTPVEAAALGTPLMLGPGMANFRAITKELLQAQGARQTTPDTLANDLEALWSDEKARETQVQNALAWHWQNQGAVERTLAALKPWLHPQSARQRTSA